jgi:hypothetical protein
MEGVVWPPGSRLVRPVVDIRWVDDQRRIPTPCRPILRLVSTPFLMGVGSRYPYFMACRFFYNAAKISIGNLDYRA